MESLGIFTVICFDKFSFTALSPDFKMDKFWKYAFSRFCNRIQESAKDEQCSRISVWQKFKASNIYLLYHLFPDQVNESPFWLKFSFLSWRAVI